MATEENYSVSHERIDHVDLFNCLPSAITDGTAYDFYTHYSGFFEEIYNLLECASLENSDPDQLIRICQEIVDFRNSETLRNFGKESAEIIELSYESDPNISFEQIRISEA